MRKRTVEKHTVEKRTLGKRAVDRSGSRSPVAAGNTRAPRLVAACFAAVLMAAGPGTSALGVARSLRWRARPYPVVPVSGGLPVAFLQHGPRDCGPAALATVLAWRGRPAGEGPVLRDARLRADGVSLAELARLAAVFELPGAWYDVPRRRLGALPTPFIAHLRAGGRRGPFPAGDRGAGHFVAVRSVLRGFLLLADPARGLIVEREARFARSWTGRALLFDAVVTSTGTSAGRNARGPTGSAARHGVPPGGGAP